ncbi:oxidoreductase [Fulvimarina endophytica]|uniref:nitric oxide dioxygenase n=2 Tax=Fulvimarina endophytica TaxID=2293836 RepID=A0A371WZ01_9HYPH|nr:oxidoreductase [Fulvimarina endophytica]
MQPKGGFRDLVVVDKVRESETITSFYLKPADPDGWRPFEPGQFLVFRLPLPDETSLLRNYSVSSSPKAEGLYRISVKREAAREAGQPDGLGSLHLHDRTGIGAVLKAEGPRGGFVLDRGSDRPVVLLSGGVGLTPMVSMLHDLAGSDRRAIFIHACDNGEVHALRDEVAELVAANPNLSAHIRYRFPSEADRAEARHDSEGVVTRELLQSLLPLDDYDFYLCGPPPFMQSVFTIIRGLGVDKSRIAYEFFGPATVLDRAETEAPSPAPAPEAPRETAEGAPVIEFRKSGITVPWTDGAESILSFAEDQGLSPAFSCRAGICSTCKTALLEGDADYFEEPLDDLEDGEILICCSRPKTSLVLDL